MSLSSPSPSLTVDAIIELPGERIVLIMRKYPPLGWALPGGFVDVGESLEQAVVREAREETGLSIELVEQLFTYSDPGRDPRRHTVSAVYYAKATGEPRGADDAAQAGVFAQPEIPQNLAFDHASILEDFWRYRKTGQRRKL